MCKTLLPKPTLTPTLSLAPSSYEANTDAFALNPAWGLARAPGSAGDGRSQGGSYPATARVQRKRVSMGSEPVHQFSLKPTAHQKEVAV